MLVQSRPVGVVDLVHVVMPVVRNLGYLNNGKGVQSVEESEQHNSMRQIVEKSDEPVVVKKQVNKAPVGVAESVERRGSAEGNSSTKPVANTQRLAESENGLVRVRAAARKGGKFEDIHSIKKDRHWNELSIGSATTRIFIDNTAPNRENP